MISGRRSARPTLCVRSFKDCIYLGIGRQATHAREERTGNNNNNKKATTGTVQYNTIQYNTGYSIDFPTTNDDV